ncbi:MAG TPA: hypothetical protein VJH05_00855 [Candidatus Paceibacterota bacterium]
MPKTTVVISLNDTSMKYKLKFLILNLSFWSFIFNFSFTPLVHAGWLDNLKTSAGLVQGFSSIPSISGGLEANGEVPVFDKSTRAIEQKEVGTKKINIPGLGKSSLPVPGASGSDDSIAYQLARMAINKITKDIVNWIRTGGRGSKPLFVTNWEEFLKDVANEASGIFIKEFELTEICQPFKPRLQLQLGFGQAPYYQRAQCTIRDVAKNVENFYKDFKQGGWERWFQITLLPQNNFYGSYYLLREEQLARESGAIESKKTEALAGGGFLGVETCISQIEIDDPSSSTGKKPLCLNWRTTSPGTLIQDQLEEVFSSDIRQLELADEIDEIVAAAFQRLASSIRSSNNNKGVVPVNTPPAEDPLKIFGENTKNETSGAVQQVSNSLELPQAISLAQQTISIKQDSLSKAGNLLGILESINSCLGATATSTNVDIAKNNIKQLEDDIENLNIMVGQLQIGEQELARSGNTDDIYQLFTDLRAAVDIVISLYDSAVTENSQIAGEVTSAEQELETCQKPTQ